MKAGNRYPWVWGGLSLAFAVLWLSLWNNNKSAHAKDFSVARTQSQSFVAPKAIKTLNELNYLVPPANFEPMVRDSRSYPDEFKDRPFLEALRGKWTIQVMDVAEHELITSYLNKRNDRNKFAYFRYTTADKEVRYILTYGVFVNAQEAISASKSIDFALPARALPEEMNRYLGMVDNYERAQNIIELAPPPKPKKAKEEDVESQSEEILLGEEEIKEGMDEVMDVNNNAENNLDNKISHDNTSKENKELKPKEPKEEGAIERPKETAKENYKALDNQKAKGGTTKENKTKNSKIKDNKDRSQEIELPPPPTVELPIERTP